MAYIQRMKPPENRVYPFHLTSFKGGVNNTSIKPANDEASDLRNLVFYDDITLEKRKGTRAFGVVAHPETVTFIDEFKPYNDADQLITAGAKNIVFDAMNARVTATTSGDVDGENYLGHYFFTDGGKFRVYGKFPQAGDTFTRIVGTATSSNVIMEIVSTPDGYTPLGTSYTKGVTVYDYTNKKVWYEPCQNEKDDPYMGLSVVPENPRYIVSLKGRMYVSGNSKDDDNVFITPPGNPYYFPPALPMQLPPNSDKVMGMTVYDDSVVVGREMDIHVITGVTNNPDLGLEMFELRKLNTHTGFANNHCMNIVHNYLFFIGSDGNAYMMNNVRSGIKILSTSQINKKIDFMKAPFYLKREDMLTAVTVFHDNVWYVSVKDLVFLFYFESGAWVVLDGLKARSFYVYDYKLIWGSELRGIDTGYVFEFGIDYMDDGNVFNAYWESGNLDMDDPSTYKHFRDVFLVAFMYAGYTSDIQVGFELDYADISNSFTIENATAKWGVAKFGDKYNAKPINPSLPFTIGRRARTIKIRFENSKAQPMRVLQINGEYELRGKR